MCAVAVVVAGCGGMGVEQWRVLVRPLPPGSSHSTLTPTTSIADGGGGVTTDDCKCDSDGCEKHLAWLTPVLAVIAGTAIIVTLGVSAGVIGARCKRKQSLASSQEVKVRTPRLLTPGTGP